MYPTEFQLHAVFQEGDGCHLVSWDRTGWSTSQCCYGGDCSSSLTDKQGGIHHYQHLSAKRHCILVIIFPEAPKCITCIKWIIFKKRWVQRIFISIITIQLYRNTESRNRINCFFHYLSCENLSHTMCQTLRSINGIFLNTQTNQHGSLAIEKSDYGTCTCNTWKWSERWLIIF